MQANKKNISKELILETTLSLIAENGGIKDVNLRGIAKTIGCNHTNLYNYFDSLDDIFWAALEQVILKMINYVDTNIEVETDPEEKFYLLLSNIVNFYVDHPGWYRFIRLDALGGKPSPKVINTLSMPSNAFISRLIMASNNLSKEKSNLVADILISYLHGELGGLINNRSFTKSIDEAKTKILSNLKYLYKALIRLEDIKA